MTDEIEMLRARLREVERERDEARALAERYQCERGAALARLAEVEAELRDTADGYAAERWAYASLRDRSTAWFNDMEAARAEAARLTARLAEVEAGAAAMRAVVEEVSGMCSHPRHNGSCLACEARRALLPGGGA